MHYVKRSCLDQSIQSPLKAHVNAAMLVQADDLAARLGEPIDNVWISTRPKYPHDVLKLRSGHPLKHRHQLKLRAAAMQLTDQMEYSHRSS